MVARQRRDARGPRVDMSMRLWHRLRSAWANLVHRDHVDASLDDELGAYADLLTAEYERRGYTPIDARRAALVEIGGVTQVKESTRDAWSGDAFASSFRELRYTWRSLRRSPGFLVTVVLIFALGIGANATIFGVIDHLLCQPPRQVTASERIAMLSTSMPEGSGIGQQSFNYPVYRLLKSDLRAAEEVAIAPWASLDLPLGRGTDAALVRGLPVSASYFPLLGVRPERGRFFSPDEDAVPNGSAVAVISDGFWTRHFQRATDVIGRTLDIGTRRFTVTSPPDITLVQQAKAAARVLQIALEKERYDKARLARLSPHNTARTVNHGRSDRLMLQHEVTAAVVLLIATANDATQLLARV